MQPNSPQDQDPATQWAIVVAALVLGIVVITVGFEKQIVWATLWFAEVKAYTLAWISSDHAALIERSREFRDTLMAEGSEAEMSIGQAFDVLGFANRYWSWLFALILGALGVWLLMGRNAERYKRSFTMDSLLRLKAKHFHAVRPIIGMGKGLVEGDLHTGPWRVAEDYIRFSLRFGLIEWQPPRDDGEVMEQPWRVLALTSPKDVPDHRIEHPGSRYRLNENAAKVVMADQLGTCLYQDSVLKLGQFQSWPPEHRALLAAFLLFRWGGKNGRGREAADHMFKQYNTGFWHQGKNKPPIRIEDLDMRNVNYILATCLGLKGNVKPDDPSVLPKFDPPSETVVKKEIRKIFARHAWLNTAMFEALEKARERGILMTATFIWLRPIDRTLWYTLNNAGRNNQKNATAYCEAAGVTAHFMVEDSLNRGLETPEIRESVKGLKKGLYDEGWID